MQELELIFDVGHFLSVFRFPELDGPVGGGVNGLRHEGLDVLFQRQSDQPCAIWCHSVDPARTRRGLPHQFVKN